MAQTRPVEIKSPQSTTALLGQSFVARSPRKNTLRDDYIEPIPRVPELRSNIRLALPAKWRSITDYEECDNALLEKLGLKQPEKSFHDFKLYVKTKDKHLDRPPVYFIKKNEVGFFHSEFEAFHDALLNLIVPDITPSAHVIYDPMQNNLPIGICTQFDKTFVPVKLRPVTIADLRNPEIVKWVSLIINSAYLLEEDDLHARNFGAIIIEGIMTRLLRVDGGMAAWNYLRLHPKLSRFLDTWRARTKTDRFPVTAKDCELSPNFKKAAPHYCPAGEPSILSSSSSDSWLVILNSKNAFTIQDMEVYKNPDNLQNNKIYQFYKNKLLIKFSLTSSDIIKELASLYLRKSENGVEVNHIDEYTDHFGKRIKLFREALSQRYNLADLTDDTIPEKNKLYVRLNNGNLEYAVIDPLGVVVKDKIEKRILESEILRPKKLAIIEPFNLAKLAPYLEKLIDYTTNKDHTQTAKEFEQFVVQNGTKALNEIYDEMEALRDKIKKKIDNTEKPYLAQTYANFFACLDPDNSNAAMNEDAINTNWQDFKKKVTLRQ